MAPPPPPVLPALLLLAAAAALPALGLRAAAWELRVPGGAGAFALGPGWTYALDAARTPRALRELLDVSRDGRLAGRRRGPGAGPRGCARLGGRPLPLHVRLAARGAQTALSLRLRARAHGPGCGADSRRGRAPGAELRARAVLAVPGPGAVLCFPAPGGGGGGGATLLSALAALTTFPACSCPPRPESRCPSLPVCLPPGGSARLRLLCALRRAAGTVRVELALEAASGTASPSPSGPPPAGAGAARRARRGAGGSSPPQFQLPSYQVSVPENEPAGTAVIELRAHDPDAGEAGRLSYQMEALFDERSNGYFRIDADSGLVSTARALDRETKDTHVLKVSAVDHGAPRRSAATYLTVTVSDTNDHGPVFEQSEYRERVRENLEVGYEVLTIRATDGDAPSNANMRYRLLGGAGGVFEIDERSGVVRTRAVVDREEEAAYQLLVEANDQGRNPGPLSATATVHIVVEDENDNYPQFSEKRYVVQVPEDVAVNTPVLRVQATDRDQGQNAAILYSIISGNLKGQFYLHSLSGSLDVINPLDFEAIREYTLRIKAQDGGRPPLINSSGLVSVQVLDVNDNAPIFVSSPFQAAVLENVPLGHSVLHIQAVDADAGENARLRYRLVDTASASVGSGSAGPQDPASAADFPFQIHNSSGWITVRAELDREEVEHYSFGVEAVDHGSPPMSSSASVSITVLDVNDNDPTFTQPVYELRLNEDAAVGSSVLTLRALDRDANSVITYQLSGGNTRNRFALSSQSGGGLITLALPLDYKQERQYVLAVTASDGMRSHTAQVFINVTDANTHRPVFQSSHYTVSVSEDRPVGTSIATISATDEDTGENARITYVLEDPVPQFRIDPDTGTIYTLTELDYEDQAAYTLAITARDNGIPQKSDTTSLEILILDANDNAPRFLRDFYQGSVFEDAPPSTSVLQVSATDRDSGPNGRLLYTFQGGDDGDGDFYIEPTSGVIRTQRRLDRENVAVYNLRALAVDRGSPVSLSASVEIQVTVLDINDNPPVFERDELELFVEENSPVGSVVARIRASDPDEGPNAQIMYQIVEGNVPEVFQLDLLSGDLRALVELDFEVRREYVLVVQATSAPLVSRATVHICLLDQNDNPPVLPDFQILFNNYVTNKSNSFPTGVIGRIPAHDPDLSDSLNYTFLQGNELQLLLLDPATGELQLSRDLDNNRPLEALMEVSVSGEHCEVSARSGRCASGVCKNGGTCVNLLVGGFHCVCPPGEFERPYCEVTTRSFPPQSFVTFRGLRQRFHFTVALAFATQERNALLLYNGRFNEKHDFIALEIVDEQVQLTFSAGETTTTVAPQVPGGVSDGRWHSVQVQYYNKPNIGRLGLPHGPSGEKVAVVTVDDCDTAVAVRFGSFVGNYSCAAQGTQSGSKKSLDLTGPLLLGGVPNLPEDFPVRNRQFVGCMRNLSVDGRNVDMAGFIANNGTRAGCAAQRNFCDGAWCQNGGTCVSGWNTYLCECPLHFGGKNCEQAMPHPQRFSGESIVSWSDLDITISVPWYLGLMFRTRKEDGVLMEATAGVSSRLHLQILNSYVQFEVSHSPSDVVSMQLSRSRVADGEWHHLLVELKSAKEGKDIKYLAVMTLDYGMDQDTVQIGNQLPGLRMRSLVVGGVSEDKVSVRRGFRGCMQGVRMGETATNVATLDMNDALKVRVKDGCDVEDPCSSSPCPRHSRCRNTWDGYSCVCDRGYFGRKCVDVCQVNPCQHVAACVHSPESPRGYVCECGSGHYGQYCENRIDLPCPKGWWGNPVCGPCHCAVSRGFDPDCNKTNGQCQCKENYYQPLGQDACLPCDCFPHGSHSRACATDTGQCSCKPGVIGRQCNRCDNPFAEVTVLGCEVIYNGCPRAFEAGIWWPQTKFGQPAAVPCPKGSVGNAVRHCSGEKGWLPPELFNCTTVSFMDLKAMNEKLSRNETRMDGDRSLRLARALRNATRHTDALFGNDVRTAYQLLGRVLLHESGQQGFELAATRDADFHEDVIQAGSALLAPGTRAAWEQIQRSEAGTAQLLRRFEAYFSNVARNLRRTYLRPFVIITPNMILAVDVFDKLNFTGARVPRFEPLQGEVPKDLGSSVFFSEDFFRPPERKEGPTVRPAGRRATSQTAHPWPSAKTEAPFRRRKRHPEEPGQFAIALVIIYRTLGKLLPEHYDPDRRSLRLPNRPVINTPVVSAVVYSEGALLPSALERPVLVEHALLETEERTKPVCVFWDHSITIGGTGGWSAKGCELVSRNQTHVTCQCSHATSSAVLMDISRREHGEVLPLKIVTYAAVSLSLAALLMAFVLLVLVRALRSNLHGIHKNLIGALFFSQLVFVIGIAQTENPFLCTVIAILLHYVYMSTFAWTFVESLHVYRMLTEVRNIDAGPMRFYYVVGWGIPAIVTGLAVGLDPQGYGNPDFCWLSLRDTLIWSFAGPIGTAIVVNTVIFVLSAKVSCQRKRHYYERKRVVSLLRTAFLLLLLISATWLLGLLAVNSDVLTFHYLFAVFSCLQGLAVLLLHCVFNREVRKHLKGVLAGKKPYPDDSATTRATLLTRSLNCNNTYGEEPDMFRTALGESTASLDSTVRDEGGQKPSVSSGPAQGAHGEPDSSFVPRSTKKPHGHDSDSDSELSLDERSSSYASSRSSDSEDDGVAAEDKWGPAQGPVHSTPRVDAMANHVPAGWPDESLAGSDSEEPGEPPRLKVETRVSVELHLDEQGNHCGERVPARESGGSRPAAVPPSQPPEQRKGILKNKVTYPPPLTEKSLKSRLREKLAECEQSPESSRSSSLGSSDGVRAPDSAITVKTPCREPGCEHLNGVAMNVRAGSAQAHGSGSEKIAPSARSPSKAEVGSV
ncbi:cadherin EGF LAG seven-pass G-type receptor 1 isoform X3 [Hippopotamus amphibius kiboko]|uniref:cadherin EGF LAG seven-pass G-type receptor 1 isoform X3 n=1 Tax=Hippopotamus amphibius kiboko TaxID=575201 RepID=UPI00259639EC|nr:cadherin EGF LAG seven-pass G-type receptor 1 isoform X3 [Hippopotamus amphibius kiboko]